MKIKSIIFLLFFGVVLSAQKPIRYQGAAYDANNELIVSSEFTLKVFIRLGSNSGPLAYSEVHAASSNAAGMFDIMIGEGEANLEFSGPYYAIPWREGSFYVNVSIDPNGGDDFTFAGSTELLSTPYAFHAAQALYGPTGDKGPQGQTGPRGPIGDVGPPGETGPIGPICPPGFQGEPGDEGPQGAQGAQGSQGAQGPQGPSGPSGPHGEEGPAGPEGPEGDQGPTGSTGDRGVIGEIGPVGPEQGPQGPRGPQGAPGDSNGPIGPKGPKGIQGIMGQNGANGPIGQRGETGKAVEPLLITVPDPNTKTIYLDDGANTNGLPTLRYFDSDTGTWINL